MAVPVNPGLKLSFGNDAWGFSLAVADKAAPKLTELNATTGINLSLQILGDSQEGFTGDTEQVSLPRMIGERTQYQVNGATTYAMAVLTVTTQPQAMSGTPGRKAWDTLVDNLDGFLWERPGPDGSTDLSVGQNVHILPGTLGTKTPIKTGTGADGVWAFTVPFSITSRPAFFVPIVT